MFQAAERVGGIDDRLDLVAFMQTLTGIPEGDAEPKLPPSK